MRRLSGRLGSDEEPNELDNFLLPPSMSFGCFTTTSLGGGALGRLRDGDGFDGKIGLVGGRLGGGNNGGGIKEFGEIPGGVGTDTLRRSGMTWSCG